ncbi:glycoside hydrolase family 5 protein [Treponema sp.]|uniref:glycoside hydrolase family 5 protein n=1 Tax=Treponema sp. TaxID=166 RepID=UPI00388E355C
MKKKIMAAVISFVVACSIVNAKSSGDNKAVPLPFQKGINVSHWLEDGPLDSLNPYLYTKGDFENMKALGFDHVRVPIQFEKFFFDDKFTVHPELLGIIDDLVRYAEELQMYFIIDFHNNCVEGAKTRPDIEKVLIPVWTQLAERYKDSSEYVIYEIMNEPHFMTVEKWGAIQGRVLKKIRSIDTKHYVVVGSIDGLLDNTLALPKYKDNKIIYTFHFYEPQMFCYQGASWNDCGAFTGIPYPFVSLDKLNFPKDLLKRFEWQVNLYNKCAQDGYYEKRFDQVVEFSRKRNAPVWNGETAAIDRTVVDPESAINWIQMMTRLCTERGIPYAIWNYSSDVGLFDGPYWDRIPKFPDAIDDSAVKALDLTVPKKSNSLSWSEYYKSSGEYCLYKNGMCPRMTYNKFDQEITFKNLEKPEASTIRIKNAKSASNSGVRMFMLQHGDMSPLVSSHSLEVTVRNENPNLNLALVFENQSVNEYELQKGIVLTARDIPADGKWHTVRIPLSKFQSWSHNPKNKKITGSFNWNDVDNFFFFVNEGDNKFLEFKEIKVVR